MLIVEIKEGQPVERALKVFKRKWEKTKTLRELRERKNFKKKSEKRREQLKKAQYVEKKFRTND